MKNMKNAVHDIAIAISELSECMARISYDTDAISNQIVSDADSSYEVDKSGGSNND